MNKALSKYSKAKWINTRLSKPYKVRRIFALMKCSSTTAQSNAHIRAIAAASGDKMAKSLAISKAIIESNRQVLSIMQGVRK